MADLGPTSANVREASGCAERAQREQRTQAATKGAIWVGPTEWVERYVAARVIRHLEPRMEEMLHQFLSSERGRDLLADLGAEMTADLLVSGPDGSNDLAELLVSRLAVRLSKDRPGFRQDLLRRLHALGPLVTPGS